MKKFSILNSFNSLKINILSVKFVVSAGNEAIKYFPKMLNSGNKNTQIHTQIYTYTHSSCMMIV